MTPPPYTHQQEAFWQSYLESLPENSIQEMPIRPDAWGFGDSPEMADELGQLVLSGIKTATCSLLWEYEVRSERVPEVGDLSLILDGLGTPICLIETIERTIQPYNQVNAAFAFDEGEDDRTLESWRKAHWRFFSRTCQVIERTIDENMPLVCERFRVIWRG